MISFAARRELAATSISNQTFDLGIYCMNLFSLFRRRQKEPATDSVRPRQDTGSLSQNPFAFGSPEDVRSIIASTNVKVFMKLEDSLPETGDEFEVSPYRVVSPER